MKIYGIFLMLGLFLVGCSPFVTKYDQAKTLATLDGDEPVHLNNSLEWWYTTGHLKAEDGREFGIEFVFFHFTTRAYQRSNYMVNFAVTDPQNQAFYYDYGFSKSRHTPEAGQLPLALSMGKYDFSGQKGHYALHGEMDDNQIALSLETIPVREPVFQNGTGYENYGDVAVAGYFSYPRLEASGQLVLAGDTLNVQGQLWYDRQWNCGTNLIGGGSSWDWISIQFEEAQEELMVYRVENRKKNRELYGGSYHFANDTTVFLDDHEIIMTPLTYWVSPDSKRNYPVSWQIEIDRLNLDVQVDAIVPHQELILSKMGIKLPYWEGMCRVKGSVNQEARTGDAYLEMTNRPKVK